MYILGSEFSSRRMRVGGKERMILERWQAVQPGHDTKKSVVNLVGA